MKGLGTTACRHLTSGANLLRALDNAATDRRELPVILRLSRRALRSRISTAARHGWIEEQRYGRGQVKVRLTPRGSDVTTRWKSLQGSAEERWGAEIGVNRTGTLRASLEQLVAALPLEHPHHPASYGAADASITGGNGQDWQPVPRGNGDTVSDLPHSALVSQALVAFAMNYEEKSAVALSLSGTVIRLIPPEGCPLQGLGDSAGISALVRHGFLCVSGNPGREIVHLTPKGFAVTCPYDGRIQAVETEWRNAFGDTSITLLRRALEEVAGDKPHQWRGSISQGSRSSAEFNDCVLFRWSSKSRKHHLQLRYPQFSIPGGSRQARKNQITSFC